MSKSDHQKPIKLIYWKDVPNLGDLLSPYIIGKLSNRDITYKRRWWGWKPYLKELCRIFIHRQWLDLPDLTHPFERVALGVGSILHYANYNSIVWGSGFMNDHESTNTKKKNIRAVRGWLSASNVGGGETVGDPALLMPLLVPKPAADKAFEIGFIPHWAEHDDFAGRIYPALDTSVRAAAAVINFKTTDIEHTISQICQCKFILSSSLHGLILAHAYGIPALWFINRANDIDGFKFRDYFSSVNLPQYSGFETFQELTTDLPSLQSIFRRHREKALPDAAIIQNLQEGLLAAFPFK